MNFEYCELRKERRKNAFGKKKKNSLFKKIRREDEVTKQSAWALYMGSDVLL